MSRSILRALFGVAGGAAVVFVATAPAWGQLQEQTWESRLEALEARVAKLEEQLNKSTASPGNVAGAADLVLDEAPVTMTLLKKEFHEGDLLSGEVGDRISLELEFKSDLNKPLRAFTGVAVFRDVFDRDVVRATLTCSKPLKPRGKLRWRGWLGYQQFDENHRRLRNLAENELDTDFILERVIYADGSRVMFSEPDQNKLVQNKLTGDGMEEGASPAPDAAAYDSNATSGEAAEGEQGESGGLVLQ